MKGAPSLPLGGLMYYFILGLVWQVMSLACWFDTFGIFLIWPEFDDTLQSDSPDKYQGVPAQVPPLSYRSPICYFLHRWKYFRSTSLFLFDEWQISWDSTSAGLAAQRYWVKSLFTVPTFSLRMEFLLCSVEHGIEGFISTWFSISWRCGPLIQALPDGWSGWSKCDLITKRVRLSTKTISIPRDCGSQRALQDGAYRSHPIFAFFWFQKGLLRYGELIAEFEKKLTSPWEGATLFSPACDQHNDFFRNDCLTKPLSVLSQSLSDETPQQFTSVGEFCCPGVDLVLADRVTPCASGSVCLFRTSTQFRFSFITFGYPARERANSEGSSSSTINWLWADRGQALYQVLHFFLETTSDTSTPEPLLLVKKKWNSWKHVLLRWLQSSFRTRNWKGSWHKALKSALRTPPLYKLPVCQHDESIIDSWMFVWLSILTATPLHLW